VPSSSSDAGYFHSRQLRHHRLKIEERFEAALRDLGWHGSNGSVRILHHPQDDVGVMVSIAETDVSAERSVRAERAEAAQVMVFARAAVWSPRRWMPDRFINQRRDAADRLEREMRLRPTTKWRARTSERRVCSSEICHLR
jgi:hypothetical protein